MANLMTVLNLCTTEGFKKGANHGGTAEESAPAKQLVAFPVGFLFFCFFFADSNIERCLTKPFNEVTLTEINAVE